MRAYLGDLRFHLLRANEGANSDARGEIEGIAEALDEQLDRLDLVVTREQRLAGVCARLEASIERAGERQAAHEHSVGEALGRLERRQEEHERRCAGEIDALGRAVTALGARVAVVERAQRVNGATLGERVHELEQRLEEVHERAAAHTVELLADDDGRRAALGEALGLDELRGQTEEHARRLDMLGEPLEEIASDDGKRAALAQMLGVETLGERVAAVEERADVIEGWLDRKGEGFSTY
jgi:hypothetical protein